MFLRRGSRPDRRYSGEGVCVGEGHVREVTGREGTGTSTFGFTKTSKPQRLISKSLIKILRVNAAPDIRELVVATGSSLQM